MPFLGDQTYVALRRLGKEVEYAKYEDEHDFAGRYANRLDFRNRIIAWFEKYLKPPATQQSQNPKAVTQSRN